MFNVKTITIAAIIIVITACQLSAGASAKSNATELGSKISDRYEMMNNL